MGVRVRAWARAVAGTVFAAALVAAGPVGNAAAADWRDEPGMLEVVHMPPDVLPWYGGSTGRGWDNYTPCLSDWAFEPPEENVWRGHFQTSETASAYQRVIAFPTETEAVAFAGAARQQYAGCADRQTYPGYVVTAYDHGSVDVEEGATVGGVGVVDGSRYHNYLYGVGRDGDTVTLVEWESNWTTPDPTAFRETVRAAVDRLY
ncbi:hypothetical protein PUR57_06660 [Streptomyces sp. JV176]|uniref:hypothetical protein n=1 Tax=Streptomyces sp. JV176 TaxID=858630 RepID=UPI002E791976|nr:hypothetical protein [Streptomyces sp. JV176]MEE1798357.1 hypothetical protein [Streptomyces sp. JV176]